LAVWQEHEEISVAVFGAPDKWAAKHKNPFIGKFQKLFALKDFSGIAAEPRLETRIDRSIRLQPHHPAGLLAIEVGKHTTNQDPARCRNSQGCDASVRTCANRKALVQCTVTVKTGNPVHCSTIHAGEVAANNPASRFVGSHRYDGVIHSTI